MPDEPAQGGPGTEPLTTEQQEAAAMIEKALSALTPALCKFRGDLVPGEVRARRNLDHRKNWVECDNPDKPLGEIVCPCQGCGPGCSGYIAEDEE
jgi:hypothetical protein